MDDGTARARSVRWVGRSRIRIEDRILGIPGRGETAHPRIAADPWPLPGRRDQVATGHLLGPEDELDVELAPCVDKEPRHLHQPAEIRAVGGEGAILVARQGAEAEPELARDVLDFITDDQVRAQPVVPAELAQG